MMRPRLLVAERFVWRSTFFHLVHAVPLLAVLLLAACPRSASGSTLQLYWADQTMYTINRSELDGSSPTTLVSTGFGNSINGLAIDFIGGKLYWTQQSMIRRANLDGTNPETLLTCCFGGYAWAIDVDPVGGKIYWSDWYNENISRSNLDGTGVELLWQGSTGAEGLALDLTAGKIYFGIGGSVLRMDLDGSSLETLIASGVSVGKEGIALDVTAGKMYLTNDNPNLNSAIQRANLDGSDLEALITYSPQPARSIAVDPSGGKFYYSTWPGIYSPTAGTIRRANLDGSADEVILGSRGRPNGLVIPQPWASVSEPSTLVFLASGLAGLAGLNWRARRRD